jgi:hypothetical protein
MRRLAYWAVLGLFAARACGSAHAAMTLVEQLLGNDSNITKPIGVFMRPNWGGGLMYLEVRRQPALPTRWTFELDWGDGTVLIVDQSHAHNWMVGRPEADRILLRISHAPSRTPPGTTDEPDRGALARYGSGLRIRRRCSSQTGGHPQSSRCSTATWTRKCARWAPALLG